MPKVELNKNTKLVAGIDIGGTNIKAGIVDVASGKLCCSCEFATPKSSEKEFLSSIAGALNNMERACITEGLSPVSAAGISIGSYVFADGSIDGMSSFVPFLIHGYPLQNKLEEALGVPVRVDNDARLICVAEAHTGAGAGYTRVLTITLGTGIGVGLCEGGKPVGAEPTIHLAGHIKVRTGGEYPELDSEPCYCGQTGCFESTCSGASLQAYVRDHLGPDCSNTDAFERALQGDEQAQAVITWYIGMLSAALNQYVYVYAPDIIVLGGGVARALTPYEDELNDKLVAQIHEDQHTLIKVSQLKGDSGILGAAYLFAE